MPKLPGTAKWYGHDPLDDKPCDPLATAAQLRCLLILMEQARIRPSAQEAFVEKHLGHPRAIKRLTANEVQKLVNCLRP